MPNSEQEQLVKRRLDILSRSAIDASRSCAIWRHFIDPSIHKEYRYQLDTYIPSFGAIERSAEISMVICLARFSDRTKGTASFPKVVGYLKKIGWQASTVSSCVEKYSLHQENWEKIKNIRNMVLAHADQSTGEVKVYKENGVTPDIFSELSKVALDVSIDLQRAAGDTLYEGCRQEGREIASDLKKMKNNLKRGRKAVLSELRAK